MKGISASSSCPFLLQDRVLGKAVASGRWGPDGWDFPIFTASGLRFGGSARGLALHWQAWAGLLGKHNPWQNGRANGRVLEGLEGTPLPESTAEQGGSPFYGTKERENSLAR